MGVLGSDFVMDCEMDAKDLKIGLGQAVLRGRVEAVKRFDGRTFTRLLQPAADAYSKPAVNEIVSKASVGSVGDEVTVRVRIAGYMRKSYQVTDRETGEVRRVQPVENVLEAVE